MPNDVTIFPGGGGQIICRVRPVAKKCAYCDREHTKLCDARMPTGKTCDRPMCNSHATRGPLPDTDFCREHAPAAGPEAGAP